MSEEAQEVAVETEDAAETVTEETPAAEAPVEEKGPGRSEYVTHFAAIAKKEAALRDVAKQAKATQAENEQLKAEIQAIKDARKLAQTNPLEFLKSNGVSIKDMLHQEING